jgi:hypothetical protein
MCSDRWEMAYKIGSVTSSITRFPSSFSLSWLYSSTCVVNLFIRFPLKKNSWPAFWDLSSSTRLTSTPNWRWPPLGTRDHAIIIITIADSGKIRGKQKNKKTDILIGASWRARVRILRSAIRNNKTTKKKVEKNQRVQSISKIKFVNRFLFFSLGEKSHALDWALARIAHLKINKVASSISNEIHRFFRVSSFFRRDFPLHQKARISIKSELPDRH